MSLCYQLRNIGANPFVCLSLTPPVYDPSPICLYLDNCIAVLALVIPLMRFAYLSFPDIQSFPFPGTRPSQPGI